ncbi:MAG: haloacid dehalogenase-like hydrolase [Bacteroidetes bacterium]|nr:haloacid dehalogenase-like hydrolase [Bacteroidota bacterium]
MMNIIAVIWDFDKTLINGYMQSPIFKDYNVDEKEFWTEVNEMPNKMKKQGIRVNPDTAYLIQFARKAKDGTFKGLNNAKLREYGQKQEFYAGIPDFLMKSKEILKDNPECKEYGVLVEHYIVSTGFAEVIRGSELNDFVEDIWGCELIEGTGSEGESVISESCYTIDNTTKTKAIFEINKGVNKDSRINVNSKMNDRQRRVAFQNMIYIADGPSDVPAFSLVKKFGGSTFAIYPKGDERAFKQVEKLREDERIDMFAEADYTEGSTAYMWIVNKIKEYANRIIQVERNSRAVIGEVPQHLI